MMELPPDAWLAIVFAVLMAVAMLMYAILDGFDLGVGILLRTVRAEEERDHMVASIGPFWDANETWLVLGVGLLLVAFPKAHGMVLTALYLPVALMLAGLILRGVAFEFRAKAPAAQKPRWDVAFQGGSILAAFSQGWMLGGYVLGFSDEIGHKVFALLVGVFTVAGYTLIGACWLVWRTEGGLQRHAATWARRMLFVAGVGVAAISLATPWASPRIFARWFTFPDTLWLAPIPVATGLLFLVLLTSLARIPREDAARDWVPFASVAGIVVLCFLGMGYSFWPDIVPGRMTIFEAASAPDALRIILYGAVAVLPMILGYTVFIWHAFRGKARMLHYGGE